MISIIIPTYHRTAMLIEHLTFLQSELNTFEYEVIVVNDAKDVDVILPLHLSEFSVINNPKSGVASARNFGAAHAKYQWLLFVDDDMKMGRADFENYLERTSSENINFTINLDWKYSDETNLELTKTSFGRFLLSISYNTLAGWNNLSSWPKTGLLEHNGLASCNLLIHKTIFEKVNGYDEQFSHAGAEDFEFSQRLLKERVKTYIDNRSQMIHNELDRLSKKAWFKRKYQAGITNRIAYEKGYEEVLIPKNWKYKSPIITNNLCKSVLFFTERTKLLDRISFMCYKLLLGQALNAGFYHKKQAF